MSSEHLKPASEAGSAPSCTACGGPAHTANPVAAEPEVGPCPSCGAIPAAPGGEAIAGSESVEPVESKHPLWEIIKVATPSVATMTSYTAMQFIDALMVKAIDPSDGVYLSAQGNGGLAAWLPMSLSAGMVGVVNTYVAQHLGAGRPERGPAYGWNGIWIAAIFAVLLVPYGLALPAIFAWSGHSARLVELETQYASVLIAGAFFSMAARAIAQYFYGMHCPGVILLAVLASNVVNVVLNYVLIYGSWGAPALGVRGAAIATVAGTAVELLIPMAVFLGPRFNRLYGTRAAWRPSLSHLREIWTIGWPGAITFGNEMICWAYFVVVLVAGFGEHHNTATWIAHRYMHLSFMPAVGISYAMTAIIGKCLGAKRPDLAQQRARLGIALSMGYMGLCGLAFVLLRGPMAGLFSTDAAVLEIASSLILIAAIFQLFDGLGITIIGILRGAGDTKWPGVLTVVLSWGILAGGGHLAATLRPEWGSLGPWSAAAAYIIVLGLCLGWRFARGKWRAIALVKA